MKRLFTLAIFISATLLFMVQPLAAKILLPVLGGSPAVWSTCMVFFQAVLLLGYLYAHALSTRVVPRWQLPVHICVLIVASVTLLMPIEIAAPGGADPQLWLLRSLASTIGIPFFALSTTARTFCTPRATPEAFWDCLDICSWNRWRHGEFR
jgi:hypothetical protein